MSRRDRAAVTMLAVLVGLVAWTGRAEAVSPCGGESDTMACGAANPCGCCEKPGETWPNGTCGNCVWHAWHAACNGWGVAIPWACTDAHAWNELAQQNGYSVDGNPQASSIFVCEASSTWSAWGHVGWIVSVNTDGTSNTTEQFCSSTNCGTFDKVRWAGFADAYIHHGGTTPVDIDGAAFVSETIPDGTQMHAGESFVKQWTMRNTGNTTWTSGDGYTWDFVEQEQFGAAGQTALSGGASVAPGDTYDWQVSMTAPSALGTYRGYWRMNHAGTGRFGDKVWVEINVISGTAPDAGNPDTGAPDTGSPDTGTSDAETPQDSGMQPESGTDASATDSAASDGGTPNPWPDSGGPASDGGSGPGASGQGSDTASGCACRAAARSNATERSLSIAALLFLAVASRWRVRPRRR